MDEQTAIQSLKRGDIGGLEFLVSHYQRKAVQTAYLITRDPAMAEDVVQDCFLQAYRSIGSFDSSRVFGPWFLRSVVRASWKAAQKAEGQILVGNGSDMSWFENLLGRVESAEWEAEASALQREIWDALRRLSPRQRSLVIQRYFLEMSEQDIATQTGRAVGTVKWLLHAARSRLRAVLSGRSVK